MSCSNNLLSLPSYIRSQTVSVAVSTTLPAGGAGGIGAVTAPGRNAGLVASGTSVSAISSSVGAVKNCVRHMPYPIRSEEHTSELQSLMRISYAVFCLKKKKKKN